jgi:predicted transcriptional regulator
VREEMMFNKRRTELEIIQHILDLSQEGAKKTEIMYKNNMSFAQLTIYLDFLLEKDIIEKKTKNPENPKCSSKVFITTRKGDDLLKEIHSIMNYFE